MPAALRKSIDDRNNRWAVVAQPNRFVSSLRFEIGDRVGVKILKGPEDRRTRTCPEIPWTHGQVRHIVPAGARVDEYCRKFAKKRLKAKHMRRRTKSIEYVVMTNEGVVVAPAHRIRRFVRGDFVCSFGPRLTLVKNEV